MDLSRQFSFDAAHRLPHVPAAHPCAGLHGHSYRVTVGVRGPVDAGMGWVIDFADVKAAVQPLLQQLHRRLLNDIDGLANPTSENLALWLWERLRPTLPLLSEIVISETCTPKCVYRGE
jgi:6-pyruvoyltetrahydropterin/6-carboxytetrahydropterin synthase